MSHCHKSRKDEHKNDHCKGRRKKWEHKHDHCYGEKKRDKCHPRTTPVPPTPAPTGGRRGRI